MNSITGMYGIKYNKFGEAFLFIEHKGQIMQIDLNRNEVKKLIKLLEAVELSKLIGGEE